MSRAGFFLALFVFSVISSPLPCCAATLASNYTTWSASGDNAGPGGPHRGYSMTTRKCAVCHSVHNASATSTYTSDAQVLLRTSIADACTFCHVSTNVGGLQIYGGVVSSYQVDDIYGHNGSYAAKCADCHSVHGANTFGGAVSGKVLKRGGTPTNTAGNVQAEAAVAYGVLNGGDLFNGNTNRHAQISAFCTMCHKVWTDSADTTIVASGFTFIGGVRSDFVNQTFKGHPLATDTASYEGTDFTGRVAWESSLHCRSCHAAGTENVAGSYTGLVISSFPHYTPNRAGFLVAGWGTGDPDDTAVGMGNPVNDPTIDGVCLRCHVDDTGNLGVGKDY